eukprot:4842421-Pyramimonas_sp.AAC.2
MIERSTNPTVTSRDKTLIVGGAKPSGVCHVPGVPEVLYRHIRSALRGSRPPPSDSSRRIGADDVYMPCAVLLQRELDNTRAKLDVLQENRRVLEEDIMCKNAVIELDTVRPHGNHQKRKTCFTGINRKIASTYLRAKRVLTNSQPSICKQMNELPHRKK